MNLKKHRFTKKKKVRHLASGQRTFASAQAHAFLNGLAAVAVIAFISFYFFLTPVNPQSIPFWLTVIIALFAFAAGSFTDHCQRSCQPHAGSGIRR